MRTDPSIIHSYHLGKILDFSIPIAQSKIRKIKKSIQKILDKKLLIPIRILQVHRNPYTRHPTINKHNSPTGKIQKPNVRSPQR
jgi:hypothetical protein